MPWTKNSYPDSMKNLKAPIQNKAIEIANKMVQEGYEEGRAISIAISQSKVWYESRGGKVSSDITHHLVPNGGKWNIMKKNNNIASFVFDTKKEALEKLEEISKKETIKTMIHDAQGKFQDVY